MYAYFHWPTRGLVIVIRAYHLVCRHRKRFRDRRSVQGYIVSSGNLPIIAVLHPLLLRLYEHTNPSATA
jgi:hypothetical protein